MTQDPRLHDHTTFPDPVYKETVLRPLFDGAKTHHVEGFRAIDRFVGYILLGAAIVVPAFIILRLASYRK